MYIDFILFNATMRYLVNLRDIKADFIDQVANLTVPVYLITFYNAFLITNSINNSDDNNSVSY